MRDISAIILAAGESKRMGFPKPMLVCDDGRTLVEHQTSLLASVGVETIIVVVGADADAIMERHPGLNVQWAVNKDWRRGQFSSLQTGLKLAAAKKMAGTLVMPVDTAGVSEKTIAVISECARQNPHAEAIVPEYNSRRGHPVYLSKAVFEKLLAVDPGRKDARLDNEIKKMAGVIRLPVNDPAILKNANTPAQWKGSHDL